MSEKLNIYSIPGGRHNLIHTGKSRIFFRITLTWLVLAFLFAAVNTYGDDAKTPILFPKQDEKIAKPHTSPENADGDNEGIRKKMKKLIDEGNYQKALDLLRPYTSDPLTYPEQYSDYIVMLVWDSKYEAAMKMYETLPASFPKRAYLKRNIGKAYYEMNNFSMASLLYREVVEQTPEDKEAQNGLVSSLIQTAEYDAASRHLERFLKEDPHSLSLALSRGRLTFLQGEYVAAFRQFNAIAGRDASAGEQAYRLRDDLIDLLTEEKRQALTQHLLAVSRADEQAMQAYLLILIQNREYKEALSIFEASGAAPDNFSNDLLCRVAWAYFKTEDIEKAENLYKKILSRKPAYGQASRGLAYILAAKGQGQAAFELLDPLLLTDSDNLEIWFARAFAYEKMRMFWDAVVEYDRILARAPGNRVAMKLKLRALSDLGASLFALERAVSTLPRDEDLQNSLKGDVAVKYISWQEPVAAIGILSPLSAIKEATRYRYDYLTALHENYDMEGVVHKYEELLLDGLVPPPWVLEQVASAYLYLEQPSKALEVYDRALEKDPRSYNGRKGKFYALQELRKWQDARNVLDEIDREQPEMLMTGSAARPNWYKLETAIDRGWFILYEEKYREAETYFWDLREKAPANMSIRNGLAHTYLWRGWPRRALREFKIIETIDPLYKSSLIGKSVTLDALAYKEESRALARNLLAAHPKDKHVLGLVRRLAVEDMRELAADFSFTADDEGFDEIRAETTFAQPVSPYTRLYGTLLWQRSSDDNNTEYYRRAGLGIRHIFNSSWNIEQKISMNYNDGKDFGSFTQLSYTPDDYWRVSLSYDSFATDVPLRARVFGITSTKLNAGVILRESEWRSYGLSLTQMKFSDNNRREQAMLRYEQGMLVRNDWKMRLFFDIYFSRNSLRAAPYFNPAHDMSVSVTHMTEQTLRRIYNKVFVHKLFLTVGTYKQEGFSHKIIGSIRYQQEHEFSDTLGLLWGLTAARQVYDGEAVHSYSVDLSLRGRF